MWAILVNEYGCGEFCGDINNGSMVSKIDRGEYHKCYDDGSSPPLVSASN